LETRAQPLEFCRWVQDKILRFFGRAALLRRPRIQARAAALPYREGEEIGPAPIAVSSRQKKLTKRPGCG
jgi:hypothetical protein